MSTASDSKKLHRAIASRDAANSIKVANDSRAIAIAASRDSAVMRIITAITMVFLPATFVAVGYTQIDKKLLSMTMF